MSIHLDDFKVTHEQEVHDRPTDDLETLGLAATLTRQDVLALAEKLDDVPDDIRAAVNPLAETVTHNAHVQNENAEYFESRLNAQRAMFLDELAALRTELKAERDARRAFQAKLGEGEF